MSDKLAVARIRYEMKRGRPADDNDLEIVLGEVERLRALEAQVKRVREHDGIGYLLSLISDDVFEASKMLSYQDVRAEIESDIQCKRLAYELLAGKPMEGE